MISTDGTLSWSLLHRLDLSGKNAALANTSTDLSVDLQPIKTKHLAAQLRWAQSNATRCGNFTWGLSQIIARKLTCRLRPTIPHESLHWQSNRSMFTFSPTISTRPLRLVRTGNPSMGLFSLKQIRAITIFRASSSMHRHSPCQQYRFWSNLSTCSCFR